MLITFSGQQVHIVTGVFDSWSSGKAFHNLNGVRFATLYEVLPSPILERQWHFQSAAEFRIGTGYLTPHIAAVGAGQHSGCAAASLHGIGY